MIGPTTVGQFRGSGDRVDPHLTDGVDQICLLGSACGHHYLENRHRGEDVLEDCWPKAPEPDALEMRRRRRDGLRAEDLAGRRVRGEARREVEGRPEVAPLELDDGAAMHSEPKQRKERLRSQTSPAVSPRAGLPKRGVPAA